MISRLVCLVLGLVAAPVLAHSEGESAGPILLDCEHPPAEVVSRLPDPVAATATMECTPSAQFIVAAEGWSWRYPGSFFDRPLIPAYAPTESRGTPGPRYFTGFSAEELSRNDVLKSHEKFAKALPTYRESAPPARVVKLVAVNDLGHKASAYFGFRSDREGWVVLCAPDCAPEYMFLIQKIE